MAETLSISCQDCVMRDTTACEDCLVTFVCGREPDEAVVFALEEERAVRLLAGGGLLPRLRHAPRSAASCF